MRKPQPTPTQPPAAPTPRGRGRPALYGKPPEGASRQSIYATDAEMLAVREFLRRLREPKSA